MASWFQNPLSEGGWSEKGQAPRSHASAENREGDQDES